MAMIFWRFLRPIFFSASRVQHISDMHSSFHDSRSLYAIARPSVCLSSVVSLSSVTLVRPTKVVRIFGNISTALGTLAIH